MTLGSASILQRCENYRYFHNKDLDLTEAPHAETAQFTKHLLSYCSRASRAQSAQTVASRPPGLRPAAGRPHWPPHIPHRPTDLQPHDPLPCTHARLPAATRPSGTRPASCSSPHQTPRASCQPLCWLCGCPYTGTHAGGSRECSSALRVRHRDKVRGADSLADAKAPLCTASFQPRGEHLVTTQRRLRIAKQMLGQRLTCHVTLGQAGKLRQKECAEFGATQV